MKEFIEKLIGRLENHIEYCKKCHEEFPNAKMSLTYEVQINAYKNVIEIVNQLAEEYNNDFCEWKQAGTQAGLPFFKTCKRIMPYKMNDDKKFCPYCGKKIKVIE